MTEGAPRRDEAAGGRLTPARPRTRGAPPAAYTGYGRTGHRTGAVAAQREARLTAEATALIEARTMFASMPTPHRTLSPMAHST